MTEMKGFSKSDEIFEGDDKDLLSVFTNWHDGAKTNRMVYDWNWYLFDNYYKGNHYIQFNKKLFQIVTPPIPRGQVRLVVNKIFSNLRAIRNFATSYRPKWEVIAKSNDEEVKLMAKMEGEILDYLYDYLKIKKKTKGAVLHAEKYGIGFFQYGFDEEAEGIDGQKGEVDVWIRDPFDVFLDPAGMDTGDIQNCRFIDIVVSKPLSDIASNPHYKKIDISKITGDDAKAASQFKDTLIKNYYHQDYGGTDKDLKTVLLHETWYKKQDKEGNTEVWIASWIEGHLLRNEIASDFKRYPLVAFSSDENPNEIYGEGFIKNLIPIAKGRNRLESQVLEYNNLVNRGRYITEKDSGFNKITNESSEVIEINPGNTLRELRPGGLAPDIQVQIARLNSYDQEISGVTDAFMGNVPQGVTAGVAMESLRAQSANNLQELKDNLEEALAELGKGILDLIAEKYLVSRQMQEVKTKENFPVIGEIGAEGKEPTEGMVVVKKNNQVKVEIGSGIAYTLQGKREQLKEMLSMQVIDPQTYLELYEFGNVEEVMERVKQNKMDEAMLANIEKQGIPGQAPQGTPPQAPGAPQEGQQPTGGDDWLKLADDENAAMLQGEELPPTPGAPKEHTAVHVAGSQSEDFQNNEQALQILFAHLKGEEEAQGMTQTNQGTNVQGQK